MIAKFMDNLNMIRAAETQATTKYNAHFFFDFGFGVILPILFLIIDPAVFKGPSYLTPGGILGAVRVFAYVSISLGVVTMSIWLLFRDRLVAYSGYFEGIFLMAEIVAFLISIILIPFSVIGIFIGGIGCLGIFPFFTAFVFYSQKRVARTDAVTFPNRRRSAFIGAITVIAIPILLQWGTSRYVNTAIHNLLSNPDVSPQTINQIRADAVEQLKVAFWCGDECFFELAREYYGAYNDPARRQYLADVYREITHGEIDRLITNFSD